MLALITSQRLRPHLLIGREIGLDQAPAALTAMGNEPTTPGITVIKVS